MNPPPPSPSVLHIVFSVSTSSLTTPLCPFPGLPRDLLPGTFYQHVGSPSSEHVQNISACPRLLAVSISGRPPPASCSHHMSSSLILVLVPHISRTLPHLLWRRRESRSVLFPSTEQMLDLTEGSYKKRRHTSTRRSAVLLSCCPADSYNMAALPTT